MKTKTTQAGNQTNIEVTYADGDSSETVAQVTVVGLDGRRARAWLRVRINRHGKACAAVSKLGSHESRDTVKEVVLDWLGDLA